MDGKHDGFKIHKHIVNFIQQTLKINDFTIRNDVLVQRKKKVIY